MIILIIIYLVISSCVITLLIKLALILFIGNFEGVLHCFSAISSINYLIPN